jgi:hypothetical protein
MLDSTGHLASVRRLPRLEATAAAIPISLLLGVLAIYGDSLHDPFVFDDLDAIVDNASLRSLTAAWSPPPNRSAFGS